MSGCSIPKGDRRSAADKKEQNKTTTAQIALQFRSLQAKSIVIHATILLVDVFLRSLFAVDCHIYEVQFSKCFGMVDMEAHKTRFVEEVDNGSPSNRESRNLEQIGSDWNAFL